MKLFSVMPAQAGIQGLLLLRVNATEIRFKYLVESSESAKRLYRRGPECGGNGPNTCIPPQKIALGPHDLALHVLAHEFGHILGFKDVYFRGYQDLGADGYQVMEVGADLEDIMGAPGNGRVLRHHFERIIGKN